MRKAILILILVFLISMISVSAGEILSDAFNCDSDVTKYFYEADYTNNITQPEYPQGTNFINTDGACTYDTLDSTGGRVKCTGAVGDTPQLANINTTANICRFSVFNVSELNGGSVTYMFMFGPRDGDAWSQASIDWDVTNKMAHISKNGGGSANTWEANFTVETNKIYIWKSCVNQSSANKWVEDYIYDEDGTLLDDSTDDFNRRDWDNCNVGGQICGGLGGRFGSSVAGGTLYIDEQVAWDRDQHGLDCPQPPADITPPAITSYNVTSSGGCTNWNANKSNPCSTNDTTPNVDIITNEAAFCRIGISDLNYTGLGAARNCTGGGSTDHACDLKPADELTKEDSTVYIGCQDSIGNENQTSTSGALKLTITGLPANETVGDDALVWGIGNSSISGATIITDHPVYAQNLAGDQSSGIFDRYARFGDQRWAFNYVTTGDPTSNFTNMFNLTPVLYVLELENKSKEQIQDDVSLFINNTKT